MMGRSLSALAANGGIGVLILSRDTQKEQAVKDQPQGHLDRAPNLRAVSQLSLPATQRGHFVKRAFDLISAVVVGVLASPLLLSIAMLIKVSSPGPVIFWQRRLGLNGQTFRCYKFRTMTVDAEEILDAMLAADSNLSLEFQARAKLRYDPRLTRYGRMLRRSSMDELPQLFNVLRGEMSIVGPRPLVPEELARYGAAAGTLLSVKPGITGLWQVSGRNNLSYEERIAVDMTYIAGHDLGGDIAIMARTLAQIFSPGRNGAY